MQGNGDEHARALARTELWLVRHAESTGNRDGIIQGHEDLPLSPLGHHQAQLLAKRLQGVRFAALYCSDLSRAKETARYAAGATGLLAETDRRLREVDTGAWSGLTVEQIARKFPEEWARWSTRDPAMRRGGGESYREAAARIAGAIEGIARTHAGGRVLIIFHGTVLRLYLSVVLGLDLAQNSRIAISNTGLCRVRPFEFAGGGTEARPGQLLAINDLSHLEHAAAAAAMRR
jgi:broad specificity phosphatase PhoE